MMRLDDLKGDSCLWCGKEIDLSRPHAIKRIYCCRRCVDTHASHLDTIALEEAKRAQNRRCAQCGSAIPVSKQTGTIYCSRSCARKARPRPPRPRVIVAAKFNRHCRQCHGPIAPDKRLDALYCSRACTDRAHHRRRPADRRWFPLVCEACGTSSFGSHPRQRFCGLACFASFARRQTEKRRPVDCMICGTTFRRRYPSDAKVTCSGACAGALRWQVRRAAISCEAIS